MTLKRNTYTVWLDYQKVFDLVTHGWLLRLLKLEKVLPQLIWAIERLEKSWSAIASLHGTNETVITDIIKYLNGIFQGDILSVLLFVLCLNPLSFLLWKQKGCSYGKNRNQTLAHNFFEGDLKLYALSLSILKKQLDLVTTFSKDIGMKSGQDKWDKVFKNRQFLLQILLGPFLNTLTQICLYQNRRKKKRRSNTDRNKWLKN